MNQYASENNYVETCCNKRNKTWCWIENPTNFLSQSRGESFYFNLLFFFSIHSCFKIRNDYIVLHVFN